MLKLVVLCVVAAAVAEAWTPAVVSPTLYGAVPTVYSRYYHNIPVSVVPVVREAPLVYSGSPYVHVINKRQIGVISSAVVGAAAAAANKFADSYTSGIGAAANAANPNNNGQQSQGYPQQQSQGYPQQQNQGYPQQQSQGYPQQQNQVYPQQQSHGYPNQHNGRF